jgi:hypothetical protein
MKYIKAVMDLIEARMYMCILGVVICVVGLLSPSVAMEAIKKAVTR